MDECPPRFDGPPSSLKLPDSFGEASPRRGPRGGQYNDKTVPQWGIIRRSKVCATCVTCRHAASNGHSPTSDVSANESPSKFIRLLRSCVNPSLKPDCSIHFKCRSWRIFFPSNSVNSDDRSRSSRPSPHPSSFKIISNWPPVAPIRQLSTYLTHQAPNCHRILHEYQRY